MGWWGKRAENSAQTNRSTLLRLKLAAFPTSGDRVCARCCSSIGASAVAQHLLLLYQWKHIQAAAKSEGVGNIYGYLSDKL